jgi:hypothetical protein
MNDSCGRLLSVANCFKIRAALEIGAANGAKMNSVKVALSAEEKDQLDRGCWPALNTRSVMISS